MDELTIYLKMKSRINAKLNEKLLISQIATVSGEEEIVQKIASLVVHVVRKEDHNIIVIDVMHVIKVIHQRIPNVSLQTIGPAHTIVQVNESQKKFHFIAFFFVWLLLFFGSGLAIMNFHEDVSMRIVHQKIYAMITGTEKAFPLLLQIPYSIGLGIGMILFFNHVFKKKFNEEPSPLDIEMFNYQQDLDAYLIMNENKEYEKEENGS